VTEANGCGALSAWHWSVPGLDISQGTEAYGCGALSDWP
jgi:hypothetical protein